MPSTSSKVVVRRIVATDQDTYRAIRLRALADSPDSFGSTYAEEAARPDSFWLERVAGAVAGADRAIFLALDGAAAVGLGGCVDDEEGADRQLVGMWVDGAYRGVGVGAALVESVVDWCREIGARDLALWVTRGNEPARRLYERMGFVVTGDVQPLPSNPCKDEVRMLRRLG